MALFTWKQPTNIICIHLFLYVLVFVWICLNFQFFSSQTSQTCKALLSRAQMANDQLSLDHVAREILIRSGWGWSPIGKDVVRRQRQFTFKGISHRQLIKSREHCRETACKSVPCPFWCLWKPMWQVPILHSAADNRSDAEDGNCSSAGCLRKS